MSASIKNLFAKKAKGADLYFYGEIDPYYGIGAKVVAEALKEVGPVDLDIYVNSPGGSVFEGIAIYNQLVRHAGKKTFHVDALAASIASVIIMAGEVRVANNSQIMIHDPWGFCGGSAEDMRKYADLLDQSKSNIVSTYVGKTRASRANIESWMKAETWMTAEEAVKKGFADKLVESIPEEAKARSQVVDISMVSKFKNTPPELRKQAMDSRVLVARMQMRSQHRKVH